MLEQLPTYIAVVFGLTTLATFLFFYWAIRKSEFAHKANIIGFGMIVWLVLQMILTLKLVYVNTVSDLPPLFPILGFLPAFLLMIVLFNTKSGKAFIDALPLSWLTHLSIVRIPVEFVLWWLFIHNTIPELMTFEGRNFDILAGITAPFVAYFGYTKSKLNKKTLLAWNILSLGLLINIIVNAMLSLPTAFQQFALDQPNIGLLYFPFFWLPSFIVPVVLFTHFVSIRQLVVKKEVVAN